MKFSFPSPAPTLGDDIEEAVRSIAQELGCSREEMLRVIVREWLEQNAYIPVLDLNDGDEADGNS
ncbi:ribbon-helix-helix domain-containing protein [Agrobacterium sp. CNPSo 3708]|uniref:ribbon-helix-helix domain-containing protein n=1 Tax=Agrobacterium sp. CNPSo 3708 TaxID=3028150 RepID=UPI002363C845|nr:ribbon-helix-helix domain-containing protein [Agrobacterium sp. CNPSo 3708]MDD1498816.1 ribbon-helix-helix domain-containing protein [Agrobacterium sp. CNPSo 3708]